MMPRLVAWFRGRTSRERLLLQAAAFLIVLVGGPLWAWSSAAGFREAAARDLEAAVTLQRDEARLAVLQSTKQVAPPVESDGTARSLAQALATQAGLKLSRIDSDGPTGFAAAFEPASAVAIYRWIDGMERSGLAVTSVLMTRAGEGDVVAAQVRAAAGPR